MPPQPRPGPAATAATVTDSVMPTRSPSHRVILAYVSDVSILTDSEKLESSLPPVSFYNLKGPAGGHESAAGRSNLGCEMVDPRDATIARLNAELAGKDAELAVKDALISRSQADLKVATQRSFVYLGLICESMRCFIR